MMTTRGGSACSARSNERRRLQHRSRAAAVGVGVGAAPCSARSNETAQRPSGGWRQLHAVGAAWGLERGWLQAWPARYACDGTAC